MSVSSSPVVLAVALVVSKVITISSRSSVTLETPASASASPYTSGAQVNRTPSACKNLNHGRSNVSINFCPECGNRFDKANRVVCGGQKHMDYRKQRFAFCMDCGQRLSSPGGRG